MTDELLTSADLRRILGVGQNALTRWGAPFHAHHQPPCSPAAHPLSAPFFTCYRVQA